MCTSCLHCPAHSTTTSLPAAIFAIPDPDWSLKEMDMSPRTSFTFSRGNYYDLSKCGSLLPPLLHWQGFDVQLRWWWGGGVGLQTSCRQTICPSSRYCPPSYRSCPPSSRACPPRFRSCPPSSKSCPPSSRSCPPSSRSCFKFLTVLSLMPGSLNFSLFLRTTLMSAFFVVSLETWSLWCQYACCITWNLITLIL